MENFNYPVSGDSITREAGACLSSNEFHCDDTAFDPALMKNADLQPVEMPSQELGQPQKVPAPVATAQKVQVTIDVLPAVRTPPQKIFTARSVFQDLLPNQKTLAATTLHFSGPNVECWKICNRISAFLNEHEDEVSMSVRGTTLCVTKFEANGNGASCGAFIAPFVDAKSKCFAIEFRRDHGCVDAFSSLYHDVRETLEEDTTIPLDSMDSQSNHDSEHSTAATLESLDLNLDWLPDMRAPTQVSSKEFYGLAMTGGENALEAAQMLSDSAVEFDDTSCAEFWMALKLLLASQRDAVVMPVLKYAIAEASSTSSPNPISADRKKDFGVEFVEVGLGREVADVMTFEDSGLLLVRKAGELMKVLADSLWMVPKENKDADLKCALLEFHEVLLQHEVDLPHDNEAKRDFYQCFTTVKQMLSAQSVSA